jgi:hypothetical protein
MILPTDEIGGWNRIHKLVILIWPSMGVHGSFKACCWYCYDTVICCEISYDNTGKKHCP